MLMHKAVLFKKSGGRVQCTACRHFCTVTEGRTGICGVRKNVDSILYLTVYGKAVAVNVDPIEKKPLFHFLPGTKIFSLGTVGCNFACDFCQNWDISQASKGKNEVEANVQRLMPEDIVDACLSQKIPSIAYTYNEPAVFFEYAYDTAKLAHKNGIKNVFVSNGYESDEALEAISPYLDAINVDIKSFSEDFYQKRCHAKLDGVLATIRKIHELGIWMELTTLVIPGKNDSPAELTQIAEFIAALSRDIPWHVSAFYPHYKMKDVGRTPAATLEKAHSIGKKAGLNHVYVGNISDDERENTYCTSCNNILIRRSGYMISMENIENGRCRKCGSAVEGVWQ
jgi:pyruvate formate lyase activating enzyme